jgi:hypothetical protein
MALTSGQLLSPPGGAADLGAVKAGSNVTITSGVLATTLTSVSQITAGTNISVNAGTGAVTLTYTGGGGGASGEDDFAAGTQLTFSQAAAPTGWTKNTDVDNAMIRIVSGSGGGTGGSLDFTTVCTTQSVTGSGSFPISFTLGVTGGTDATPGPGTPGPQINFTTGGFSYGGANNISHNHIGTGSLDTGGTRSTASQTGGNFTVSYQASTDFQGGNQSHDHSVQLNPIWTNPAGGNHSHLLSQFSTTASGNLNNSNPVNLGVKYRDSIICTKN